MRKSVLCIHDEKLLKSLKNRLQDHGFAEIIASATPGELYADALDSHAEVAVIEYSPSDRDVSQSVKKLYEKLGIPIIMIGEAGEVDALQKWGEAVLASILAKPVREEELMAALVLSLASARRLDQLKGEISTLKESIETRKIVEKAKGRLMERDHLTEADAFRRMQRLAMDRRISMRQLAEAILLTDQIGC